MDLIDRQEILAETDKWLNDLLEDDSAKEMRVGIRMVRVYMKQMSAVQPERPTGTWILVDNQRREDTANGNYAYICSNCLYTDVHAKSVHVPYCWQCGAKMKEKQNAVN